MMKKLFGLLGLGVVISLLLIAQGVGRAAEERLTVYGVGYPPVKVQNKTQALLMAKRAAIMDAYRNALTSREDFNRSDNEEIFYRRLSGFIRGLTITREEYLNDGGIKIEATVSSKDLFLRKKEKTGKTISVGTNFDPVRKEKPAVKEGPAKVTVEEWYKIIEKMVQFEGADRTKGGE